ncbi:GNAT family protein [Cytobacillus sp.]|uniref:GNAT family N-acetyltransferase n=1 Tax=Cytobacillus sp. TaxID=2675269 RepID=UPI0028BF32B2|nr:GNAT family protein [Cytobacillus sp.]
MSYQNKNEFPILYTDRLVLREVTYLDANDIYHYLSDEEVMKYYGLAPFKSLKDAEEEIDWYRKIFDDNTGIRWGITLKGNDKVIGSCGFLNFTKQHARAEIGAELAREFWGIGIVSEAFQAILSYGFKEMELMRIQALIEPENYASQKLAEKNGFMKEGLLRKYEYTNGKFDDLYIYSILRGEFL